jgi:hypothetical protein
MGGRIDKRKIGLPIQQLFYCSQRANSIILALQIVAQVCNGILGRLVMQAAADC